MAIGTAFIFNIKLPLNFDSPYKAINIQEFWRKWHITLSRFLKDYIYIPLGGNKKKEIYVCMNLLITFLIGGIWHGAGWNFVIWGLLHGLALILYRFWKKTNIKLNNFFAWFITFNFINITWIFFRAKTLNSALNIIKQMFNYNAIVLPGFLKNKLNFLSKTGIDFGDWMKIAKEGRNEQYMIILMLILGFFIVLMFKNTNEIKTKFKTEKKYFFIAVILFFLSIINLNKVSEFLYFQF